MTSPSVEPICILASVAALAVFGFTLANNWPLPGNRNQEVADKGRMLFWIFAILALLGAFDTWNSASPLEHRYVTGLIHVVRFIPAKGRGSGKKYLVCIDQCTSTGLPLLMWDKPHEQWARNGADLKYRVGYLPQERKDTGDTDAYLLTNLIDLESGTSLYERVTALQPIQIAIYVVDAMLLFAAGILCHKTRKSEGGPIDDDRDTGDATHSELTSLGLDG